MSLALEEVGVTLDGTPIVEGVTFDLAPGERLALLGPSGSGKSTILRVAAGVLHPSRGSVRLDGRDVTNEPPHRRGVGLVFQDAVLFPHRDVERNVGFGPVWLNPPRRLGRESQELPNRGAGTPTRRQFQPLAEKYQRDDGGGNFVVDANHAMRIAHFWRECTRRKGREQAEDVRDEHTQTDERVHVGRTVEHTFPAALVVLGAGPEHHWRGKPQLEIAEESCGGVGEVQV